MMVRATTAFLLALVLQLAQLSGVADLRQECGKASAAHCECCAGPDSCHCAQNSEPAPRQAPMLPGSGSGLKLPIATSGETHVSIESREISLSPAALKGCAVEPRWAGYHGVRLSAAFCTFVI